MPNHSQILPEGTGTSFAEWLRSNGRASEDAGENLFSALRRVIDSLNLVSVTDPNGSITYANEQFCRVSGYSEEELIGRPHSVVRHPDTPSDTFEDLWKTIRSKKIWRWLIQNRKKNGDSYWVKTVIVPILDKDGGIAEYVSLRTDVTDLEIANRKLRETLEIRAELDRKKSEFVSVASHELRTPLTIVRGYASMMEDAFASGDPQTAKRCAEEISRQAAHMSELVTDMFELSRIESGEEPFKKEKFNASSIVSEVVGNFAEIGEKRGVPVVHEGDLESFNVLADREKIRRALHNLVSNAIKFTPPGWWVRSGVKKISENRISLYVRDTGTGIRKEDRETIFEKFVQLENPLTREHEGSGLGLTIVKRIAEGCGGTVELESEIGRGSEFSIVLPSAGTK